ncbi:hypothetical protein R3P38DRAFT_2800826 [Favolaschia claudopus]|uniref:Uncharacterized protein n=1 Tax=Favolaschia claudopus TaxID=2862362 RepID=A0AAV9ZWM6_9AGAR
MHNRAPVALPPVATTSSSRPVPKKPKKKECKVCQSVGKPGYDCKGRGSREKCPWFGTEGAIGAKKLFKYLSSKIERRESEVPVVPAKKEVAGNESRTLTLQRDQTKIIRGYTLNLYTMQGIAEAMQQYVYGGARRLKEVGWGRRGAERVPLGCIWIIGNGQEVVKNDEERKWKRKAINDQTVWRGGAPTLRDAEVGESTLNCRTGGAQHDTAAGEGEVDFIARLQKEVNRSGDSGLATACRDSGGLRLRRRTIDPCRQTSNGGQIGIAYLKLALRYISLYLFTGVLCRRS